VEPAPRIAVSVAGRGPLILFLHGIGGWRRHWFSQLEFFSEKWRAAAWDARGYGDSDDTKGPLDFADFTRDVVRVIDHLGEQKAHLVGLSMGGRIARNVALAHPQRVASLTLANSSPGFDALAPAEARRFLEERSNRTAESLKSLLGSRADARAYDALVEGFRALRKDSYLKALEASVAQDRAAPLEAIRVPTLVITGSEDRVYAPALARDMARRIPGARLAEFEGVGHLSNLEQPARFNQALMTFLKEAT
jgi:3-oxoadipate enol-lactonase